MANRVKIFLRFPPRGKTRGFIKVRQKSGILI